MALFGLSGTLLHAAALRKGGEEGKGIFPVQDSTAVTGNGYSSGFCNFGCMEQGTSELMLQQKAQGQ